MLEFFAVVAEEAEQLPGPRRNAAVSMLTSQAGAVFTLLSNKVGECNWASGAGEG